MEIALSVGGGIAGIVIAILFGEIILFLRGARRWFAQHMEKEIPDLETAMVRFLADHPSKEELDEVRQALDDAL